MGTAQDSVSQFYAGDRAAWRQWLAANHTTAQSVWLVYDKGKDRRLSYDAIVEEALCFGWVDGLAGKVNETQSKLYVSRRKPKGVWARTNKERVKRLEEQGLMTEAGRQAIAVAKSNGAWDQLNLSDRLESPPELAAGLAANPAAKTFYDAMPPSSRRAVLEWIYAAKTEATKLKRVHEAIELAAQGIRPR